MMFDPNQQQPNFMAQQQEAERQRAMANRLRGNRSAQPEGQMVGNTFVPPNILQYLGPLMEKLNAGWAESNATKAEKGFADATAKARSDWQSSLPRAMAATPGDAGVPPDYDMGTEGLPGTPGTPASRPDRESVLKATMAGMNIPGNRDTAMLYNQVMGQEFTREDTQADRRQNLEAAQADRRERRDAQMTLTRETEAARLAQKAENDQRRSEDTRLGIEQRAEAARLAAQARRESQSLMREMAANRQSTPPAAKPLSTQVMKVMTALEQQAENLDVAKDTFKPEFAGPAGTASKMIGAYVPGANTDAANWWKEYAKNTQLVQRHAMFGSALTATEKGAWRDADITPMMNPDLIARNLALRATLTKRFYEKVREQYLLSGHAVDGPFPSKFPDAGAPKPPEAPANEPRATNPQTGETLVLRNGQWVKP